MKYFSSFLITLFVGSLCLSCDNEDAIENCDPPESAVVTEIGLTSVSFDVSGNTSENYVVSYNEEGVDPTTSTIVMETFGTPQFTIDQLISGVTYDFFISASCENGELSEAISLLNITTIVADETSCEPPTNVQVNVIDYNEALVFWDASTPEVMSYEIEYDPTGFELGTGIIKPAFETQLLLDALIVGTTYDYYIRSLCEEGASEFSGPFTFTTRACVLPSALMVSEISTTTALASWEGNGEVSWELEYGTTDFNPGTGEVIFLGETEVTVENLIPDTTYDVYLRANCGPNGRSEYVGPLTFVTL